MSTSKPYMAGMSEYLIVDEPYVTVRADEAVPCIIVQLHAFANSEQFKQLMQAGLAYYQAHTTPQRPWGWIGDTRQMSAIPKAVQQWLAEEWNVQAYAAGLREISIISSANITAQLATQHYAQLAKSQLEKYVLESVYYNSLEEAKQSVSARIGALKGRQ